MVLRSSLLCALLITAASSTADARRFRVVPELFDPDQTGAVSAHWRPFSGPGNSDPALLLDKLAPTATNAAAGAEIDGASGIVLSELGFDVYRGGHCGAGAPRFNVTTVSGATYLFFFGCSDGDHTPSPSKPARFVRVRFHDADARPQLTTNPPWPGFGRARIASITIIFDEGTDMGSGFVALDDIDVNGELVGRGNDRDDDD
ncbi:MAG: hypothetical protein JWN44_5211 [Myxococcales bacterium]|nr:hypothetical protein [Myxococcales bacterium]